jgi:hypothetical protein
LPVTLARVARNRAMSDKNFPEHLPGHRDLGHPKRNVAAVADHLGPILISFSGRLVADRGSTGFDIASGRMKLPRCRPGGWS